MLLNVQCFKGIVLVTASHTSLHPTLLTASHAECVKLQLRVSRAECSIQHEQAKAWQRKGTAAWSSLSALLHLGS